MIRPVNSNDPGQNIPLCSPVRAQHCLQVLQHFKVYEPQYITFILWTKITMAIMCINAICGLRC